MDEHGQLSAEDRKELPDSAYAFPGKRKEPLTDADHVRNALARFDQVKDVTDAERDAGLREHREGGEALQDRDDREELEGARQEVTARWVIASN